MIAKRWLAGFACHVVSCRQSQPNVYCKRDKVISAKLSGEPRYFYLPGGPTAPRCGALRCAVPRRGLHPDLRQSGAACVACDTQPPADRQPFSKKTFVFRLQINNLLPNTLFPQIDNLQQKFSFSRNEYLCSEGYLFSCQPANRQSFSPP